MSHMTSDGSRPTARGLAFASRGAPVRTAAEACEQTMVVMVVVLVLLVELVELVVVPVPANNARSGYG